MAGTITHAYFTIDIYNNLDKHTKNILKDYKENLKTYGQGHDIFYFCYMINFIKSKKIRKYGKVFHKEKTKAFFKNMIQYIIDNKLQYNPEVLSFLYGYICHYILDLNIHPYITYKAGIFKKNKKSTYKYNSKHSDLESYIDAYMIKQRENIDPKDFKCYKFCFNNNKISKNLSNLINYTFYKTYNIKNISKYYKKSILDMKILYRICRYDPIGIKKNIYKFIDKITTNKIIKLYPVSYAYKLDNNNYYLNLDHKTWNHPRDKHETYNYSVLDLYDKSKMEALKIIDAVNCVLYENRNIAYLDNYFLDLSYSSGKPCNDKNKNKYFEY